ncbi:MAG: hypothetical protein N2C13_02750 [Chloroflexota bacterium]
MENFDIFNFALIGLILVSVPVIISTLFPYVEKTLSLLILTFGLNSFKGVVFWMVVVAGLIYLSGSQALTYIISNLGSF